MDGPAAFEFADYQPAPRAAPEGLVMPSAFDAPGPAARHAPPRTVAPLQFQARDPAQWPQEQGMSTWSRQQAHKQRVQTDAAESSRRHEFADRYTREAPTLRAILDDAPRATPPVPEQIASRAPGDMNTDFVAPGMSVGSCGQCRTLLLAPQQRPLRLKCPECAKVTLLE